MTALSSGNREIDDIAAGWVARRDAGLTTKEEAEFLAWCNAAPQHREALARFEKVWSATGRPRRTGRGAALERRLGAARWRSSRRRMASAAAVLLVMAAGWIGWESAQPAGPPSLVAPATATLLLPQHQVLPDGSRVDFPSGTELTVDFTGVVRRVRLTRGEAHFSVARNTDWPFVVEAGGVEFRAVGTAFSVQLAAHSAQLLVTEGRVSIEKQGVPVMKDDLHGVAHPLGVVEAGSRVLVDTSITPRATEVGAVSEGEIGERLAWRNPRAEFSGTPLREVVDLLNRQNPLQLVLADPALSEVQLSGVFRLDDVESLLRSLELGFGVHVDRAGDRVMLRRAAATR